MVITDLTKYQQDNFETLLCYLTSAYGDLETHKTFDTGIFAAYGNKSLSPYEVCTRGSHLLIKGDLSCMAVCAGIFRSSMEEFCWREYTEESFGVDIDSAAGEFIFSDIWGSNIQQAKARLKMFINGFDPSMDWDGKYEAGSIFPVYSNSKDESETKTESDTTAYPELDLTKKYKRRDSKEIYGLTKVPSNRAHGTLDIAYMCRDCYDSYYVQCVGLDGRISTGSENPEDLILDDSIYVYFSEGPKGKWHPLNITPDDVEGNKLFKEIRFIKVNPGDLITA